MWLTLPFGSFAVVLLSQLLAIRFTSSTVLAVLVVLMQWLFSLGSIGLNCYFLANVFFDGTLFWTGVGATGFWFVGNVFFAVSFQRQCPGINRPVNVVVFVCSVVDLTLCHFMDRMRQHTAAISSYRLGSGFYLYLPLLILQNISLSTMAPMWTIQAIFFNSLGLLLLLISELLALRMRPPPRNNSKGTSDTSTLMLPLLNPTSAVILSGPDSPVFRFLYWSSLPLVVASFIPQVLTLVGIPHTIACVRRYLTSKGSGGSRVEMSGLFLLPLNTLSFLVVLCVLLPGISLVGMLLGTYNRFQFYFTHRKVPLFGDFRRAIQSLLALLAFSFWVFLVKLPVIRFEKLSKFDFSGWKAAGIVLLFLVLEVGLAVNDVVWDFLFANQLLTLSQDPILTDNDQLLAWSIGSFISSGIGILCSGMKLWWMLGPLFQDPSVRVLREIAISNSIFGTPSKNSWQVSLVVFVRHVGDDFIQLLAIAYTSRFTGFRDTVGIKLAVSIFSVSMNLSKGIREFVFGRKIGRLAKVGLQFLYFFIFAISLSIFFGTRLDNSFCMLSRTANDPNVLGFLGVKCPSISGTIVLNRSELSLSQEFWATSISTFLVISNSQSIDLSFSALEELSSNVTIEGNSGEVTVSFERLDFINSYASLTVNNNGGMTEISLPVLFGIAGGGSMVIRSNSHKGALSLPGLTNIVGNLEIGGNSFSRLELAILQGVSGALVISREQVPTLDLPSLNLVSGEMTLFQNQNLRTLLLPSLGDVIGRLTIQQNNALEELGFPQVISSEFNVIIESNAALRAIDLSNLFSLGGQLLVANNRMLQEINFGSLESMATGGSLVISSNPSLAQLDFPALECGLVFSIILVNNTNLEAVHLQDVFCLAQFVSEENPNVIFYCNGTLC